MSNQRKRLDARTKKDSNTFILTSGCFTAAASFICLIAALVFLNVSNANIPTAFILGALGGLIAGYVFFRRPLSFRTNRSGRTAEFSRAVCGSDGGALMKAVWVETF